MTPNGLRVGTPAMSSRGLVEEDFVRIGSFIGRAVDIAAELQRPASASNALVPHGYKSTRLGTILG